MGIFNLVWQPLKLAFAASIVSAGIESQTGLRSIPVACSSDHLLLPADVGHRSTSRPATHKLGNAYSQATFAESMLDVGRFSLRAVSEVASHSGFWEAAPGGPPAVSGRL